MFWNNFWFFYTCSVFTRYLLMKLYFVNVHKFNYSFKKGFNPSVVEKTLVYFLCVGGKYSKSYYIRIGFFFKCRRSYSGKKIVKRLSQACSANHWNEIIFSERMSCEESVIFSQILHISPILRWVINGWWHRNW